MSALGTVTINAGTTTHLKGATLNGGYGFQAVAVDSGTNSTGVALTFAGALTIASGATFSTGAFAFTESTTTSITGKFCAASNTGTKTFTQQVTVNAGGTFDMTNAACGTGVTGPALTLSAAAFQNDSANQAKFGTGTLTLAASPTFQGSGAGGILIGQARTIASGATYTNNITNGQLVFNAAVIGTDGTSILTTGSGSNTKFASGATPMSTGVVTPNANSTFEYGASGQTVKVPSANYNNLTLSGGGAAVTTGITTITGNFSMSGNTTTTGPMTAISGNVSVTGTAVFTVGANLTVSGTTTIGSGAKITKGAFSFATGATSVTGTLNESSATGAFTFNSTVTVSDPGVFNLSTNNPAVTFKGNITQSSNAATSFKAGSGTTTFSNSLSLLGAGTGAMNFAQAAVTIPDGVTITNGYTGGTVTFAGATGVTIAAPTVANGLSLSDGSTTAITNALLFTANTSATVKSMVDMNGTANITVGSLTMQAPSGAGNTNISEQVNCVGTASGTLTVTGAVSVTGNSTSTGKASLTMGSCAVSVGTTAGVTGGSDATGIAEITSTTGTQTYTGLATITGGSGSASAQISTTSGTLDFNAALTFAGGANIANAVLSSSGAATVQLTGTMSGAGTISGVSSTTLLESVGTAALGAAYTWPGTLRVDNGSTLTLQGFTIAITGLTTVGQGTTGILNENSATGTKTFTGGVTVAAGGNFNMSTTNPPLSFAGNISNSGTFNSGTNASQHFTASKSLQGSANMTFGGTVTIDAGVTLTNDNTGTVTFATVNGANATTSILALSTNTANSTTKVTTSAMAAGEIVPSASNASTFDYNYATPTIIVPTTNPYYNLNLSGSGTFTLPTGVTSLNGTLALSGTVVVTTGVAITSIGGNVTVATGARLNINHNLTISGGNITNAGTGIINTTANTPTVSVSGTGSIGGVSGSTTFYNLTLSGTPTLASDMTINNNLTLPAAVTAGSTTVTMAGTAGALVGGGATLNNLTINPASAGTITMQTSDLTVSGLLTVTTGDALTINNAARTLTLSKTSGTSLTMTGGTINGPGRLTYQSTATFPTDGTLASTLILRIDTVNGNNTLPSRTDYGALEVYNGTSSNRTVYSATGTVTASSSLNVNCNSTGTLLLDMSQDSGAGATNPAVNVSGDLTFTKASSGSPGLTTGSGTWTMSGAVNFTNSSGNTITSSTTLIMNGASKTLTTASNALQNLTFSGTGTTTLADSVSAAGAVVLNSTIGAGTLTMTGSGKNLTGGAATLDNLTINGNTTLQTSNLTVGTALAVANSTSLTINSGITLTLSGNTGTTLNLNTSGTVNGPGRLTYQNSATTFPTAGTLAATLITRFDLVNVSGGGSMIIPQRADFGTVEAYNGTSNNVTLKTNSNTTYTLSGNLSVMTNSTGNLIFDATGAGSYNSPLTISGDIGFTKASSGTVTITSGTGTWTVSGSVNFTNGTYTATANNTLTMNGASKSLTTASNGLQNLTFSGTGTTTLADNISAAGNVTLNSTISAGSTTVSMTGSGKNLVGGTATLSGLTISDSTALITSNLTVSGILTIGASKTLTITTVTLTDTGGDISWGTSSVIAGTGLLTFTDASGGPATGGTLSVPVRFDASNANIANTTFDARTYGGATELYSNSGSGHSVSTLGSATYVFSSTLTVTTAGAGATTLDLDTTDPTTFTVSGTLTNGSGSVIQATSSGTFNINGNYVNSGTFTHNSGTVTAAGTAQQDWSGTLSGSTGKFNNLTITNAFGDGSSTFSVTFAGDAETAGTFTAITANTKLRFHATSTYTFQNFTTNGQATGTRVYLRSSTGGSAWLLNVAGTATVANTNVMDSNASGSAAAIEAQSTSYDATGNTNWNFVNTMSVSGTIYQSGAEGSAFDCSAANISIHVSTNGGANRNGTCTAANGTFSMTALAPSGADIPVAIFSDSASSNKLTTVTLSSGTGNISGLTLIINRVVVSQESATAMTNALLNTADNGDVGIRYNVAGGNLTTEADMELHVLAGKTFTPGGNVATTASSDTTTIAGDVHIPATAIFNLGAHALSVGGHLNNAGSLNSSAGSSVTFTSTASGNMTIVTGGATLYGLTLNNASGHWTNSGNLVIAGDFNLTAGTFTQANSTTMTVTGSNFVIASGATWTAATSGANLIMDNASGISFADNNATKQNLGTVQIGASPGTTNLTTDMSATSVTVATGDTFNTHGWDVTTTDFFTVNGTGTLDLTDNAPSAAGNPTVLDVGGDFTMSSSATFTAADGKVFMDSTSGANTNRTWTTGGKTYNDVELKNAGTSNKSVTPSGNIVVGGTLTLTAGAMHFDTNNPTITTSGNVSIANGATVTKGTGGWTFNGTTATTYTDSNSTTQNIGPVTITKTNGVPANNKVTLVSSLTVDTMTISANNTLDLASGGYTLTLANNGATATVLTVSGTLTTNSNSTVKYTALNSGGNINVVTNPYNSLTVAPQSGSQTYVLTGNLTSTNAVSGDLTIGASGTLDAVNGSNYSLAVGGSWSNSGTFTARNDTVTFTSITTGKTIATNGSSFYALTFNGSGGDWTPSAAVTVTNDLTMTAGSLLGTQNVTVNGAAVGTAGVMNLTGGTFEQRVAASKNFGPTTASTSWTFSTLTFSNSSAATGYTITAQSCSTCGVTVTAALNIGKNTDNTGATTTLSAGDKTWTLSGSGTSVMVLATGPAAVFTPATSTVAYTGTSATTIVPLQYYGLTAGVNDANNVVYTVNASASSNSCNGGSATTNANVCGGALTVATGDTMTVTGVEFDVAANATLTLNGTLNGTGTVVYQSSTAFPSSGTVSISNLTFDTTSNNITVNGVNSGTRTISSAVIFYNNSSSARNLYLGSGASQTFTFSSTVNANKNAAGALTVDATANNPAVNIGSNLSFTGAVALKLGTGTWTVSGNLDLTNATVTAGTSTVTMNGTGGKNLIGNSQYLYNLTINPSSADTINLITSNLYVTHTLNVTDGNTFYLNGPTLSLDESNNYGCSINLNTTGILSSPAWTSTLTYQCTNAFPSGGTEGVYTTTFDAYYNNLTVPARSFSNSVAGVNFQVWQSSGVNRTATITAGTGTLSAYSMSIGTGNAGNMAVDFSSSNPTVTVTADVSFSKATTGVPSITSGSGTWTVGRTANFTNGTYTASTGNTFKLNEAQGTNPVTFTPAGNSLYNFTADPGGGHTINVSGTLTTTNNLLISTGTLTGPASGSISVGGDFTNNATFSANSGTVTMTGSSNNITGSSATTFNNLTISGGTTVAAGGSDPTVANVLQVDNSKSLTVGSGRTVILSTTGATAPTLNGTINGPGRLTYRASAAFPTTGALGSTLVLRYDLVTNDMTTAIRTDYGTIEAFNSSSSRSAVLTLGNGTHTLAGNFDMQTTGSSTLTVQNTNNVAVNVTGNVTASTANGAITFSAGSNTWTVGGNFNLTNVTTFNNNSGTLKLNGTGTLTSNGKTLNNLTLDTTGGGTVTLANATHTMAGSLILTSGGTLTDGGTSTIVAMSGTGVTIDGGGKTLRNLTISGTATLQNTDLTVSAALNVADTKTLTMTGRTLTLSGNTGTTLNLNTSGTVTGGTLVYQNSATTITTSGTISSAFTFDTVNDSGNSGLVIPNRTFGGLVTALNTTSGARTVRFGSAVTPTLTGFDMKTTGTGTLLVDGATNNPTTVTVTGDVTCSAANGAVTLSMGSGNWAVSGHFNLANVTTLNHNSGTLTMTGTGTVTSNGLTLNNLTVNTAATTTLANAALALAGNLLLTTGTLTMGSATPAITGNFTVTTGTVNMNTSSSTITGNLVFNGGTITANTSTVTMNGASGLITGGGKTLNNLTIANSSGTVTLQTSDLSVSGALTVNGSGGSLTINSGRSLTVTSAGSLSLTGTVTGSSGTLVYQPSAAFPTGGTLSSGLRFDATSNDQTASARTYGGAVEFYSNSSSNARTITLASGTLNFSSTFKTTSANTQDVTVDGSANNPTVNITGDLSFTAPSSSGEGVLLAGTGTWTASGNVNLTNGFYAPQVKTITPSWDRTALKTVVNLDTGLGCDVNSDTFSCESAAATPLNTGVLTSGSDCTLGITVVTDRAGMRFNLSTPFSGLSTATITSAQLRVHVSATTSNPVTIGRNGTDLPDSSSCSSSLPSGMFGRMSSISTYANAADWGTTGLKYYQLGTTASSDIKSRIAGNITLVTNNDSDSVVESYDSSEGSSVPTLRVGYIANATSPTLVMNGSGKTLTTGGNILANLTLSSSITLANETVGVAGSLDMTSATITAGTSTVQMLGAGTTITGGGVTIANLKIAPETAGTVTLQTSDLTASGTLTVNSGDTLTLNSGKTLTLSGTSGTTLSLSGTLAGPGRLTYRSSAAFPTTGALSSVLIVRYDLVANDMTTAVRTDYGTIEAFNSSSSRSAVLTLGNGTHTLSGNFDLQTTGTSTLAVAGNTNNPVVNVTGDVTNSAANGATTLSMGSNTWTVSGSVNLSNLTTLNNNSGTLVMNGASKTLTSNGKTLNNLTFSGTGTTTLADNTAAAGNVTLNSTISAGSTTLTMSGSGKALVGGTATLSGLTLSDNTTLQTSALTVSGTLTVAASKTLTITTVTLTDTGPDISWGNGSSTIGGTGLLTFTDASGGPGSSGVLSVPVRFDASANNIANTTFDARTYGGAVTLYANNASARSITAAAGGYTFSSTLDTSAGGAGTVTANLSAATGTTTVTGNLTIGATTSLTAPSATLSLGANFTNNGGFTHSSGLVQFTTNNATTITGSTTFNNLTITDTVAKTVTFVHGSTTTVSGAWTVTGATGQRVVLTRDNTAAWNVNPSSASVDYADVNYSNNQGTSICATHSISTNGGNTNWTITSGASCGITISGTVYQTSNESSVFDCNAVNLALRVSVNGAAANTGTCSAVGGTFSMTATDPGAANIPISIYTDNGANPSQQATTVTLSSAGAANITGVTLIIDRVVISQENATAMTNAYLATADTNGDAGIRYTVSSGNLTVGSGMELHVLAGKAFTPGGTVTTTATATASGAAGDLHIPATATMTMGANALSVGGDLLNSGTLSVSSGQTTTMTATGSGFSFNANGATLASVNFSGASGSWTSNDDATLNNLLTVGSTGALTIASSKTVTLAGNSGTTLTLNGTINGPGRLTYQNSVTTFPTSGTLANSLITRFDIINGSLTVPARTDYGTLEAYKGSMFSRTVTLGTGASQTITLSGNVDVMNTNATGGLILNGATNNPAMNVGGNVTNSVATGATTLDLGSGTWSVTGNFDLTHVGTFNHDGGILAMTGSGAVTSNGQTLNELDVNSSGTVTMPDAAVLAGNLWIEAGTLQAPASTLTVAGNFTNDDTFDDHGGTVVLDPSSTSLLGGGNVLAIAFTNLTISGNVSTSGGFPPINQFVVTGVTVNGTLTVNTSDTLTLDGSAPIISSPSGTVTLVGTGTITSTGPALYVQNSNLEPTNGTISSLVIFDANDTNPNLTMPARSYGDNIELYNDTTAGGGTITPGSGSIAMAGLLLVDVSGTGLTMATNIHNSTINASADVSFIAPGAPGLGGTPVTTLNMGSGTWTVGGNFDLSHATTVNHNGGTLTLNGSGQQTLTAAGFTLNNLTITNASGTDPDTSPSVIFADGFSLSGTLTAATANSKLRFNAGSTYAPAAINFNGQASGTRVYLHSSSSGSPWTFNAGSGSRTVLNLAVKDSNACGSNGGSIDASDTSNLDEGGNTCWNFRVLSVSLNSNSIGLGALSTGTVTQGSITSTVTSTATNGYISLVEYDHTLTATNGTIADAGGSITNGTAGYGASTSKASQTIAQTTTACSSGAGTFNASSLSTSFQKFASASGTVSGDVTTLCALATPSATTVAGSYSSTLTLVTTAKF